LISFIIPCYNEEKYIRECIHSIKNECDNISYEIIVVDNNCTDNTAMIAKQEGVIVVSEKQKGVVFARQKGYEIAQYNLIANIDADSRLCKGWVETALAQINNDDVVAVTGPLVYDDVSKSMIIMIKFYYYLAWFSNNYIGVFLQGGNALIKKSALDKVNGYDTSIAFYGEDTMTAKRLNKFGEIKFDMKLKLYSSPRRLKDQGVLKTTWLYLSNYFSVTFKNKSTTNDYKDFR
jgi:cellulose synthase/poly-beta-1,6-N-acetylglucosamine synthase-like glycosyltransferase